VFDEPAISIDGSERSELFDIFIAHSEWTADVLWLEAQVAGRSRHHLIELALAGGASHAVTRNVRDVAAMELRFSQLAVLTPERFLKEQSR